MVMFVVKSNVIQIKWSVQFHGPISYGLSSKCYSSRTSTCPRKGTFQGFSELLEIFFLQKYRFSLKEFFFLFVALFWVHLTILI